MLHISKVPDSATDLSGSGTFAPGSTGVGAPRWSRFMADVPFSLFGCYQSSDASTDLKTETP